MTEMNIELTEVLSGPSKKPARRVTAPMDSETLQHVLDVLHSQVNELEATSLTLSYSTTIGESKDPADLQLRMYADGMFGLVIEQEGATYASEAMQITFDDDEPVTPAMPVSEYPH